VAGAGFAYYHAQVPTSQLYGATICREPSAGKRIALTYDDGPNPEQTPRLMALLERFNAHATFFLIGRWAEREPGLIRELHAAGHAVGNHTFTHPSMYLLTSGGVREELARCREAVEASGVRFSEVDGQALMRPPYGRRRPGTLRTMREEGYVPVTWSITCYDWRKPSWWSEKQIARKALKAGDGDVILLHDGSHLDPAHDRSRSIDATQEALEHFTAQGYSFVTVPDLVAAA
jgi:peptidoglycan/xylan/chitin deacetylase (PgdA/CDA1 family)